MKRPGRRICVSGGGGVCPRDRGAPFALGLWPHIRSGEICRLGAAEGKIF